jgi:hypothetical protein
LQIHRSACFSSSNEFAGVRFAVPNLRQKQSQNCQKKANSGDDLVALEESRDISPYSASDFADFAARIHLVGASIQTFPAGYQD